MSLLREPKFHSIKNKAEKIAMRELYDQMKNWMSLCNYEVSIKVGFLKYAVLKSSKSWSNHVKIEMRDINLFSANHIYKTVPCSLPLSAKSRCRIFNDNYHDDWMNIRL